MANQVCASVYIYHEVSNKKIYLETLVDTLRQIIGIIYSGTQALHGNCTFDTFTELILDSNGNNRLTEDGAPAFSALQLYIFFITLWNISSECHGIAQKLAK